MPQFHSRASASNQLLHFTLQDSSVRAGPQCSQLNPSSGQLLMLSEQEKSTQICYRVFLSFRLHPAQILCGSASSP